jgi:hypothetical protein
MVRLVVVLLASLVVAGCSGAVTAPPALTHCNHGLRRSQRYHLQRHRFLARYPAHEPPELENRRSQGSRVSARATSTSISRSRDSTSAPANRIAETHSIFGSTM